MLPGGSMRSVHHDGKRLLRPLPAPRFLLPSMNEFLRDRIMRKLDTLPDERLYQVLDYVEFLESKYAERQAPQNLFTRFQDGLEDTLRAGKVSASAISETMGFMNKAMGVLIGVAAAGKSIANDVITTATKTMEGGTTAGGVAPGGAPGSAPAAGSGSTPAAVQGSPGSAASTGAPGGTRGATDASGAGGGAASGTPPRDPNAPSGGTTP